MQPPAELLDAVAGSPRSGPATVSRRARPTARGPGARGSAGRCARPTATSARGGSDRPAARRRRRRYRPPGSPGRGSPCWPTDLRCAMVASPRSYLKSRPLCAVFLNHPNERHEQTCASATTKPQLPRRLTGSFRSRKHFRANCRVPLWNSGWKRPPPVPSERSARQHRKRVLTRRSREARTASRTLPGGPRPSTPTMSERRIDRRTFLKGGLLAGGLLAGGGAAIAELAKSGTRHREHARTGTPPSPAHPGAGASTAQEQAAPTRAARGGEAARTSS